MNIHNSKIIPISLSVLIFIVTIQLVDATSTLPFYQKQSLSKGVPIINITELNQNAQSSNIQNLIFKPATTTNIISTYVNKNDSLNDYVMNIFCTEVTSKYIKVATGSGVFLSDPTDNDGIVLTNAHVARHLLDANKKCVGRTGSPTTTTHTVTLRYIPSHWLSANNQYIIGDPDQSSTGEFDFALLEVKRIKPIKKTTANIFDILKSTPKLQISDYNNPLGLNNIYIYSYPAREILSKNVYNALYQKKDLVTVSALYTSPTEGITDSLLDVSGSKNVDHGSSGGMVISQGTSNSFIGLSSVLIKDNAPQVVRVVTMKHVLGTLENDLKAINNNQTDTFLSSVKDMLTKKQIDLSSVQILKNIKLTSVLEQYTRQTLQKLNIIK